VAVFAAAHQIVREFMMQEYFEQRSLEHVLADLRANYQRRPGSALAEMIKKIQAEIAYRDRAKLHEGVEGGKPSSTEGRSAA
jgi:hypothetical protein